MTPTADLRIDLLPTRSRARVYVLGGLGGSFATAPSVTMQGQYAFQVAFPDGAAAFHETDNASVVWRSASRVVIVTGAGVTWPLSSRAGLGIEVRVDPVHYNDEVDLYGSPAFAAGPPQAFVSFAGGPGLAFPLVFANGPTPPNTYRSLSGSSSAVQGAVATGWLVQTQITAVYYLRF